MILLGLRRFLGIRLDTTINKLEERNMFKNRRLFINFISGVKEHQYTIREARQLLKEFPIKVLRKIGKRSNLY